MGINSNLPTSRRGYLSQDELKQFANITITDPTEADDVISQAEEILDAYVGYHQKFIPIDIMGKASAGGSTSLTLETAHQNVYDQDYFKWCTVEIVSGTGEGQRRKITGSTKAGVLTVDSAFDTVPTSSSYYKIYQLGKFPRIQDVEFYSTSSPNLYIKSIPENVKRAVAAQLEFIIEMGDSYFAGDESDKTSESIGDYSYSKTSTSGFAKLISPKAKLLLQGYVNRTGQLLI